MRLTLTVEQTTVPVMSHEVRCVRCPSTNVEILRLCSPSVKVRRVATAQQDHDVVKTTVGDPAIDCRCSDCGEFFPTEAPPGWPGL